MAALKTDRFLQEARRLADEAGKFLLSKFETMHEVVFKGEINPVTEMDGASEKMIVDGLRAAFPDHGVLAEEGTLIESKGSFSWLIDPLDGTTNYAHGFHMFSVSVALLEDNRPVVGVITVPKLGETFHAARGEGAFLNGRRIHVSEQADLGKAFFTTGVPYSVRENPDFHLGLYKRFIMNALAIRRAGSACIDLSYVAAGRFDGYWEGGLQPWDAAAGILLVEEAGGKVSDLRGAPYVLKESYGLLTSNGRLHQSMLEVING